MTRWVLVDDLASSRSAEEHMALDYAMLAAVRAGSPAMFRLYQWTNPTLSIGRFQVDDEIDGDRCRALGIDVVRRPTGGRALLHGADLTYAVAMPAPVTGVLASYAYLARALAAGLARCGVHADVAIRNGDRGQACFASHEGADLAVAGRKICGSAQLQQDGALLQHGAILLDRLAVNETDVLAYADAQRRTREAQRLVDATVTLRELGAPHDAPTVAAALIAGFGEALDVQWEPPSEAPVVEDLIGTTNRLSAPVPSA
ncbi:MAG: lipoate--protein ligase family protein [Acidimicrobiia bacterium]